jgi:hypothetical protein
MKSLAANERLEKAGPTGPAAGHLACALRPDERFRLREGASARTGVARRERRHGRVEPDGLVVIVLANLDPPAAEQLAQRIRKWAPHGPGV